MRRAWRMGILISMLVSASACDPLGTATESTVRTVPGVLYVSSQTGNNDANGQTRDTAFRTIARALENAHPGDTVLILPGVYEEALTLEGLGDASAPITIRGEDGVPVLDGQRVSALGIWCEDCTNLVFEHLEIRDYTDVGIGVSASADIVMRDLIVYDNGFQVQLVDWELEGYGIHVEESQNVIVEDNDVYQNGPPICYIH